MAIKVTNISKLFGNFEALQNINFDIRTGEVVGLLGPNGAGKSTLMKILCGIMPASSGKAFINGHEVQANSILAKNEIGYLPENNPLYTNMYIKEFLGFSAGFYNLGKKKTEIINEVIELTGLNNHLKKKIGVLSKGLKQRVGLAQALLHDPAVLVLDEPTSGLDPNQIVEIRNLISTLGVDKTILFSSHIMQEVEAVCERIIILNEGCIIADAKTSKIKNDFSSKTLFKVEFDEEVDVIALKAIHGVVKVVELKKNMWHIASDNNSEVPKELMQFALAHNLTILSLQKDADNLESVFQELTKKQ